MPFSTLAKNLYRALPDSAQEKLNWVFERLAWGLPEDQALAILFRKSHGFWPDFENPRSYSEKIVAMRLANPPLAPYADKIGVRDFVAEKVGPDILIPLLFVGKRLPPREVRDWPLPFIIKTNNGSGDHVHVRSEPDWDEIERKVQAKLEEEFWKATGEMFYKDIDPKIMVEPLIGGDLLPLDFKFFMFGDEVGAIIVNSLREQGTHMNWYDEDWNRLDVDLGQGYPTNPEMDRRPEGLDEMIRISRILGKPFPAVRVDLYWVDGKAWFSELTFTSGKGMMRFKPQKFDFELGKLWDWSRPFVPEQVPISP